MNNKSNSIIDAVGSLPVLLPIINAGDGEWGLGIGYWGMGIGYRVISSLLPTPYCPLPTPHSLLPTPYCPLPTPHSLLPTPHSLLPTP
ncbi:hypothetical protein PN458_10145, partial [Nodularia spumigena CS-336/02]|nr:hypothetical protein [Nodularia spumigena CS-336/02]